MAYAYSSYGLGQVDDSSNSSIGGGLSIWALVGLVGIMGIMFWPTGRGHSIAPKRTRKQRKYGKGKSSLSISSALNKAYQAGKRYGDTGEFDSWLERSHLEGRGVGVVNQLESEFARGVEGEKPSKENKKSYASYMAKLHKLSPEEERYLEEHDE